MMSILAVQGNMQIYLKNLTGITTAHKIVQMIGMDILESDMIGTGKTKLSLGMSTKCLKDNMRAIEYSGNSICQSSLVCRKNVA